MDHLALYNDLTAEKILGYVSEGREENLFLEFKTATSEMSRDDRKNLAKALSGFANSSGGVVIWGVFAGRNDEGIDCAQEARPIQSLPLFLSRLNEFTGQSVGPIAEGVQHRILPTDEEKGFAVTLIPESSNGPHMAKAGEDRYYKRSGDSFYKMEHFDIADMFGRRQRPELSLAVEITPAGTSGGPGGTIYRGAVILGIRNQGRGTARAPMLAVRPLPPGKLDQYGLDGNFNFGMPRVHRGTISDFEYFGSSSGTAVHPGTVFNVAKVNVEIHESQMAKDDLVVDWQIAAEDIPLISGTHSTPASDLSAGIKRN